MNWIPVTEQLPPAKEGWSHSEQVLVHYDAYPKGESSKLVDGYGIAYYHYDPPYSEPGWRDFGHPNRVPTHWMPIKPVVY